MNKMISRAPIIGFALLAGLVFIGYGTVGYIWNPEKRDRAQLEVYIEERNERFPEGKVAQFALLNREDSRRTYDVRINSKYAQVVNQEDFIFISDRSNFWNTSFDLIPKDD